MIYSGIFKNTSDANVAMLGLVLYKLAEKKLSAHDGQLKDRLPSIAQKIREEYDKKRES